MSLKSLTTLVLTTLANAGKDFNILYWCEYLLPIKVFFGVVIDKCKKSFTLKFVINVDNLTENYLNEGIFLSQKNHITHLLFFKNINCKRSFIILGRGGFSIWRSWVPHCSNKIKGSIVLIWITIHVISLLFYFYKQINRIYMLVKYSFRFSAIGGN